MTQMAMATRSIVRRCALVLAGAVMFAAGCDDDPATTPANPDGSADTARNDAPMSDGPAAEAPAVADGNAPSDGPAVDGTAAPDSGAVDAPPTVDGVGSASKLDLVFVIDNSSSMTEEQNALRTNFPQFIVALAALPGGLPDLRIAILSSNLGAGPTALAPECTPGGDGGRFQIRPECGLIPATSGRFLRLDRAGNANFPGGAAKLGEMFACLAALGTGGCGYEHPLASLAAALGPTNNENAGFLRDDALLAIVILSDEDDCSAAPNADFFANLIPMQSGSVRCSLRGHTCNGQPLPVLPFAAALSACTPYVRGAGEATSRLTDVATFVDVIKAAKKGRTDQVLVSAIVGWDDNPSAQYTLIERPSSRGGTELDTGPICQNPGTGTATPALRLHAFAKAFPNHTVHSICSDLPRAMGDIGQKLAGMFAGAAP
jgi:hypothetical protein